VWDNPPIVIGAGSYLDRVAELAGARNVFHDLAAPSAQVSLEAIARRDPRFLAVLDDSAATPALAGRQEWQAVAAVRERRFLRLPGPLFGRPGPRAVQAVGELRRLIEAAP
jgi:ABC-type Fe3+-hydroxamate transport system substrate-binding protein